ncbi:MAG TPA: hypothetical protein PLN25_10680 [Deltaproteobacteria bacterium]|nr:hypothetical protein [Deltaproteobacteria bacterium]HQB39462.1 hypothetical protein [Deltaproteobacteria bacterium]
MNSRRLLLATAILALLGSASTADAIEGYPGSTWGEIRQELPNQKGKDGPVNLLGQGYIEQGVDWTRWGSIFFNSYATVRYKFDTMHYDWNNSVGPGVGLALTHYTKNGGYFRLGVEHNWETFYNNGKVEEKTLIYLRWFQYWNLKK